MKPTNIYLIAASFVLIAGCADETTTKSSNFEMHLSNANNAKVGGVLSVAAVTSFVDSQGVTFHIEDARLHIRDVIFDASGSRHTINGPFEMNLLTGAAKPANISSEIPAGDYNRIDVRVDASDSAEGVVTQGDALDGNSLVITGTHDAGTSTNSADDGTFSIVYKLSEDIRFDPATPISVDDTVGASIALKLDVTDWLVIDPAAMTPVKLDLTSCLNGNTGPANVDISYADGDNSTDCNNTQIENVIKTNMKNMYDYSNS